MEVSSNVSCIFSDQESTSVSSDISLKRKRGDDAIHTPSRRLACKCSKVDTVKAKHDGSVPYECFSPEIYSWLAKFSGQVTHNFERSGTPVRFLFFDKGEWKNFDKDAMITLRDAFRASSSTVEFLMGAKKYVVNFVSMWQLNALTGYIRSVAWIDEQDKCYFPSKAIECHFNQLLPSLQDAFDYNQQVSDTDGKLNSCVVNSVMLDDGLISADDRSEVTSNLRDRERASGCCHQTRPASTHHDFTLLGDRLHKLDDGDEDFSFVREKFLTGLGVLANHVDITSIHNTHTSTSGHARLQAFDKQEEITKAARGDANLRYAWHGTSKDCVSGIVLHGFGQPRIPKNGAMYGVGVYLAPEDYAHVSAVYSDVDENGEQHMLLCRVIMGSMEEVSLGSEQFHPSSEHYDTGVDDMSNPKRYVIWSTHMNTHILPQYVVSFKLAPPMLAAITAALRRKRNILRGHQSNQQSGSEFFLPLKVGEVSPSHTPTNQQSERSALPRKCYHRLPRSPWISFSELFASMKTKLPPAVMVELQRLYLAFQAGRIPRDLFVKTVRTKVSDNFLRECIKNKEMEIASNFNKQTPG